MIVPSALPTNALFHRGLQVEPPVVLITLIETAQNLMEKHIDTVTFV